MHNLSGARTIITGGASGIGEAAVRAFHAAGATVLIADIDDARGARDVRALRRLE